VMDMVQRRGWFGRVEHSGFSEPETYYQMVKHVRAEVGIAPLIDNRFNQGKCVDATMRVSTNAGIVEAGKIKPGMKVWRDGWKKVEAVQVESPRDGLQIETKSGYSLRLSSEHRMFVNGQWTMAKDIAIGSVMAMSREQISASKTVKSPWPSDSRMNKTGRPRSNGTTRYSTADPYVFLSAPDVPRVEITPRWGRIFGAYAGDGSVGQMTAMQISCDGQDQDWIDMLMDDFRAIGLNPGTEAITTFDGKVIRRRAVRVSSAHLLRFMESLGLTRPRKNGKPIRVVCVPEVIWNSPKEVISEFLSGYFEADGCTTNCGVSAVSKGKVFLQDVQRLLIPFGIVSRVGSRTFRCQTCKGTYWYLTMNRDAAGVFEKEIGFKSKRKRQRLSAITAKKHSNAFRPMAWEDEVAAISPCVITPVDIQVEGREFVLAGFVSHNSELKFLENTVIGMPTVASRVAPYENAIKGHKNGILVSSPEGWHEALMMLLSDAQKRKFMLAEARKLLVERYDIRKVALEWAAILCK